MKAAVVESFESAPRYTEFEAPVATPDEVLVTTKAAAVTQLARILATGKHYAAGKPPFVPGTTASVWSKGSACISRSRVRPSAAWAGRFSRRDASAGGNELGAVVGGSGGPHQGLRWRKLTMNTYYKIR